MTEQVQTALSDLVRQRQTQLDEAITAWRQEAGSSVRLWCGPGCGNCCGLTVNATALEATVIAGTLAADSRRRLAGTAERILTHARQCADARSFLNGYRRAVGPCPFLDEADSCTVYPCRPLACRALLATRPPDWCGVNLAGLPEWERQSFLTGLDRNVVAWPTHYAAAPQDLAAELERGLVFAMLRVYGFGVTGNLPLLVHLATAPEWPAALAGGPAAFQEFLAVQACDRPFLAQLFTV